MADAEHRRGALGVVTAADRQAGACRVVRGRAEMARLAAQPATLAIGLARAEPAWLAKSGLQRDAGADLHTRPSRADYRRHRAGGEKIPARQCRPRRRLDRKSTRLNSSH